MRVSEFGDWPMKWHEPNGIDEPIVAVFNTLLLFYAARIPDGTIVPDWDCAGPCLYLNLGVDFSFYGFELTVTISHHANPIDGQAPYWLAIAEHEDESVLIQKSHDSLEQARDWIEATLRRKAAALVRCLTQGSIVEALRVDSTH